MASVFLSDTHPTMALHQIALMRAAGTQGRLEAARNLTSAVIELSRSGLRQRYPAATQAELDRMFVEFHYGERVARLLDV